MKKWLVIMLTLALALSLCACGTEKKPSSSTTAATRAAGADTLLVGFGRVNITPPADGTVNLFGYGDGDKTRAFTTMMDPIYATCVAITDAEGNTVLIYTLDKLYTMLSEVNEVRAMITAKTGIPGENVVMSGTHTHSSVRYYKIPNYAATVAKAAEDALADRAPATVQVTSRNVENMNFVRHYNTQNGIVVGDNFAAAATDLNPRTSHTTQADGQMQLVRYVREGKKDVVLCNWQVHPLVASSGYTVEGNAGRNMLSADFIGYTRFAVEKEADCLFAYYSGACGNLNPRSLLEGENTQISAQVKEYGDLFALQVLAAMEELRDTESGKVSVTQKTVEIPTYVHGKYANRSPQMELTAIRVGNVGFATVPFEMFDTSGKQLKEASPFETTFVLTNAHCEEHEYIPNTEVWDYDTGNEVAYEISSCAHERGAAEKVVENLTEMLTGLS